MHDLIKQIQVNTYIKHYTALYFHVDTLANFC